MNTKKLCPVLGLILLQFAAVNPAFAESSTDGIYTIQRSTFGALALRTADSTHQVTATAGQTIAGGSLLSGDHIIDPGFWQGSLLPVSAGDLNDDGRVELADLVYGLKGLTGQATPAINDADVNGDGKIDPAELVHIMRYQAQLTQ